MDTNVTTMPKLSKEQKQEIITLIKAKEKQLGSLRAVATFLDLSPAVISQMVNDKYETKGDDAWLDVMAKLSRDEHGRKDWKIVPTMDLKQFSKLLDRAKSEGMFISISDYAGIGKSAILKHIAQQRANDYTYYLRCMDWGKTEFLMQLCKTLGIDIRGYKKPDEFAQLVINFFRMRMLRMPQLILDEFEKLKPAAKMILIYLFNECEDNLSIVIAGTENLEKEIKSGVQHQVKGYDEIDSRFGRKYLKLLGCTEGEAAQICKANGIDDADLIKQLFEECKPTRKDIKIQGQVKIIRVITDLRRLKTVVRRELFKMSEN